MQVISRKKAVNFLAAAALGGVIAIPAMAQSSAQVQVEGVVDAFVGSLKSAGDSSSRKVVDSAGMTTSYLGFRGSEDLGGGVKASFALTSFYRVDIGQQGRFNGNETFFSRDANVGLSGGFGSVTVGRALAPNFLPSVLFNPFGDSFTFSPLILHFNVPLFNATGWSSSLAGDTGWSNHIRYTTPSFGGLTTSLFYQFGEEAGNTGKNNAAINMMYFAGPLSLTAFYHDVEVNNPLDTPVNVVKRYAGLDAARQKVRFIGGAYDFNVVKLFATYDKATHDVDLDDKTFSLGASVPVGAGKIMAAWAQTKRDAAGRAEAKRDTVSLGYDYSLSKRTDVYAVAMRDKITDFESGNSFGAGIRHRF